MVCSLDTTFINQVRESGYGGFGRLIIVRGKPWASRPISECFESALGGASLIAVEQAWNIP